MPRLATEEAASVITNSRAIFTKIKTIVVTREEAFNLVAAAPLVAKNTEAGDENIR